MAERKPNRMLFQLRAASLYAVMHYFIIALLTFSFSWQQSGIFANSSGNLKERHFSFHAKPHTSVTQVSTQFPIRSTTTEEELEMELTEEDESKAYAAELYTAFVQCYQPEELFFTSSIKSRFLQLANAVHKRPAIPFFILHHSWKAYLS